MLLSMVHRKTWVITKLDQAGNGTQRIASCLEDMVKNVKSVLPSNTFVVLSDAHPSCKKKKKKSLVILWLSVTGISFLFVS